VIAALAHGALTHPAAVATITWDPFIRGTLIIVVALLVFPGSVYLLLSTNTGVRLGFLLAAAALTGWCFVMAVIWAIFGIGDVGRAPSWKPLEVISGDLAGQNTVSALKGLPADLSTLPGPKPAQPHHWWEISSCNDTKWRKIDPAKLGDPESAADKVLVPSTSATASVSAFAPPFKSADQYVPYDGFDKNKDGGCLFQLGRHKFYGAHQPHYVVLREAPAKPALALSAAPQKPVPDLSKPFVYVVLVRDLGSMRQPPIVIAAVFFVLFVTITFVLHQRDKEIMAAKAAASAEGAKV
jgi:hypothetical protein